MIYQIFAESESPRQKLNYSEITFSWWKKDYSTSLNFPDQVKIINQFNWATS